MGAPSLDHGNLRYQKQYEPSVRSGRKHVWIATPFDAWVLHSGSTDPGRQGDDEEVEVSVGIVGGVWGERTPNPCARARDGNSTRSQ